MIFEQIDKMCTAYRLLVFIAGSSIGYIAQGKRNWSDHSSDLFTTTAAELKSSMYKVQTDSDISITASVLNLIGVIAA